MSTITTHIPYFARRAALALALAAGIGAATSSAALAETYTVTRTDDPPPANCIPGDCTLREAINAADNGPGANDTIELQGGQTYTLRQAATNAPRETGGALIALHNVRITSTGATNAVINGNGGTTHDRVFDVLGGGLELHNVDVTGGVASRLVRAGGGGILVDSGAFYMFDGSLGGNSAPAFGLQGGGGIYNYGGHAVLQRVMVAGNQADNSYGGGIYTGQHGLTEIYDSKLFDNHAALGGALASDERGPGGGVYVNRVQISFNRADTAGGAAFDRGALDDGGVTYRFANVTINNNLASHEGGALSVWSAHVTLNNDTLTLNTAPLGGGISAHANRYEKPGTTAVRLSNTIVAQNVTKGINPDCLEDRGGEFVSGGFNLIGDYNGCFTGLLVLHRGPGDQAGSTSSPINARLHTTAFNGGRFRYLLTAALDPGSPAINAGDPAGSCEPTDARDVPRSTGGRCDIGAYEVTPGPVTITPHGNPKIALALSRSQIRAGNRVLLTATLSSTDRGCISGATLHAGPHHTGRSDSTGHVTIAVRFRHAGFATITAAKAGCVTGTTTLRVAPAR
jgi:CSLREA domain-containing protein